MHSAGLTKFFQFYEIAIGDLCICSRCLIWITITILTGLTFGRYHIYCPRLWLGAIKYEATLGNICRISLKASPYYTNKLSITIIQISSQYNIQHFISCNCVSIFSVPSIPLNHSYRNGRCLLIHLQYIKFFQYKPYTAGTSLS